jgi:Ca-activated chloride channel family protein
VAIAVVLDRSGSMSGEKIDEARRAVVALVQELRDDDVVSVVLYSDAVEVLQAPARVGLVRQSLVGRVLAVAAGGGTDIPRALDVAATGLAGAPATHARRVVLVSDGLDHSGWGLDQVRGLVRRSADLGTTVAAFGVGTDYSEPFMTAVADAGRGTYAFLERGSELGGVLRRELAAAAATVADGVTATLTLAPGWRLAEAHGVEPFAAGQTVALPLGALAAGERRRVVLAFDVDAFVAGTTAPLALAASWRLAPTGAVVATHAGAVALRVVGDERTVAAATAVDAHARALEVEVDAAQVRSIDSWRAGDAAGAVQQTADNIETLRHLQASSYSAARAERIREYERDVANFRDNDAQSAGGRAYGLRSNDLRRARTRSW